MAEALGVSCDALLYPRSDKTNFQIIQKLLDNQPEEFVEGIKQIISACVENFEAKIQKQSEI